MHPPARATRRCGCAARLAARGPRPARALSAPLVRRPRMHVRRCPQTRQLPGLPTGRRCSRRARGARPRGCVQVRRPNSRRPRAPRGRQQLPGRQPAETRCPPQRHTTGVPAAGCRPAAPPRPPALAGAPPAAWMPELYCRRHRGAAHPPLPPAAPAQHQWLPCRPCTLPPPP